MLYETPYHWRGTINELEGSWAIFSNRNEVDIHCLFSALKASYLYYILVCKEIKPEPLRSTNIQSTKILELVEPAWTQNSKVETGGNEHVGPLVLQLLRISRWGQHSVNQLWGPSECDCTGPMPRKPPFPAHREMNSVVHGALEKWGETWEDRGTS